MSDLSPRAEELLRVARENEAPRPGQKEHLRAALLAALPPAAVGTAATAASSAASSGTGAVATKTGTTLLTKVILSSLIGVSAVGGGVYAVARQRQAPPVATAERTRPADPVVAADPPPAVEQDPTPTPVPDPVVVGDVPRDEPTTAKPEKPPRHRTVSHRTPKASIDPVPVASAGGGAVAIDAPQCSLNDELELLQQGQAALREGHAELALQRFSRHRTQCANGTLSEEREAGRIIALCALKRSSEAQAALRQFKATTPRSPHLPRVEQACREASGP